MPRCATLQASREEVSPGWGTARPILGLAPRRTDSSLLMEGKRESALNLVTFTFGAETLGSLGGHVWRTKAKQQQHLPLELEAPGSV